MHALCHLVDCPPSAAAPPSAAFAEDVELAGHVIDSLLLSKILDKIIEMEGSVAFLEFKIGERRHDSSYSLLRITGRSPEHLDQLLNATALHGAVPILRDNCTVESAETNGAFPEGFYATTKGDLIVKGRIGIRALRETNSPAATGPTNDVESIERQRAVRTVAAAMRKSMNARGGVVVLAGGPLATSSRFHLEALVRQGCVNAIVAGGAFATCDLAHSVNWPGRDTLVRRTGSSEKALDKNDHLRAINHVRRAGGIGAAIAGRVLTRGIIYECIRNKTPFMMTGSDCGTIMPDPSAIVVTPSALRDVCQQATSVLILGATPEMLAVRRELGLPISFVCGDSDRAASANVSNVGASNVSGSICDAEQFLALLAWEMGVRDVAPLRKRAA